MKIKPAKSSGSVLVELGPTEGQLPAGEPVAPPLFNLRRILVPVDFSECSRKALQYAIPLAKQFGATLILLNVVEPYYPNGDGIGLDVAFVNDQANQAAAKVLAEWMEKEIPDEIEAQRVIRLGNPYDEIVHAAESMNLDLIILSTHGRTGLKHAFLGSVAEKVVQHATCPVLVVREREHEFLANTPGD